MKRWIAFLLRSKDRKLELSTGGKWYLAFTLLTGMVAISSGNNVIYLIESLLLSSLLVSGVLSELTLKRLSVRRSLSPASANQVTGDALIVENSSWLPLYCVEILEWRGEEFEHLAFLLYIPGRAKVRLRSKQILKERGRHYFDGLALATSFPFGFARKIRMVAETKSRIIWPEDLAVMPENPMADKKSGREFLLSEGELEEVAWWQGVSRVHWPSSARSRSLMARPLDQLNDTQEVVLKLASSSQENEKRIRVAAAKLRGKAQALLIQDGAASKKIFGSWRALDTLALLPKGEGR